MNVVVSEVTWGTDCVAFMFLGKEKKERGLRCAVTLDRPQCVCCDVCQLGGSVGTGQLGQIS